VVDAAGGYESMPLGYPLRMGITKANEQEEEQNGNPFQGHYGRIGFKGLITYILKKPAKIVICRVSFTRNCIGMNEKR
jgi:hypothetical protein